MVMCVDTGVDLGSPAVRAFARSHNVRVQNAGQFQFQLNVPVGVEGPVTAISPLIWAGSTSNNHSWQP
jgi:hypothetical protein